MAIRKIRVEGDPILYKTSKQVTEMNKRNIELIEDMLDTMYDANGVGLAAPQIGVLKRIVVIDVSEEGDEPMVLINPIITQKDGEQKGAEGCLSVPGKHGVVTRADHVICKALDENMQEREIEGTGLLARAIQHELDHLEGIIYTSKVEGELMDNSEEE